MGLRWKDVSFVPSDALVTETLYAWKWLIGDYGGRPILCSNLGDLFLEQSDGKICWLNCSAGSFGVAAPSRSYFDEKCRSGDESGEWFGWILVEKLHAAGKFATDGQCYSFIVLPIFAECKFEPDNVAVVSCREVFVGLGDIHWRLSAYPDGSQVTY
jgi:hypothetical protein